jgi:hypothetical protein
MRIRTNFLVAVAGLILGAGLACGQNNDQPQNGYWWAKLNQQERVAWIVGFNDGSEVVRGNITTACLNQAGASQEQMKQQLKPGPIYEAAAADCDKKLGLLLNPYKPPKANGQIIDGLNQFYADYRNKNINVLAAVYYVYQELDGVPQNLLDEFVRSVRQDPN